MQSGHAFRAPSGREYGTSLSTCVRAACRIRIGASPVLLPSLRIIDEAGLDFRRSINKPACCMLLPIRCQASQPPLLPYWRNSEQHSEKKLTLLHEEIPMVGWVETRKNIDPCSFIHTSRCYENLKIVLLEGLFGSEQGKSAERRQRTMEG